MPTSHRDQILGFYRERGRMPGYAEIMALTGFKSKNAVWKLIGRLVDEGVVAKDARGRLSPRHVRDGARLLGLVEAGFPTPAEEELLDTIDFDEYLVPNKESAYILRVKGDSMVDAGIHPGDMIVVERRASFKPGQIVVAAVDGEYTVKYLRGRKGAYYLEPANKRYKPIHPTESLAVEAVVTAVVRRYQ